MIKPFKKIIKLIFTVLKYYLLVFSLFVIFLSFIIPVLENLNIIELEKFNWFYELMSRSCHQGQVRSFTLFSLPLAICSRCLGIYIGSAFGFFITRTLAFSWQLLCLSITLMFIGLFEKYLELIGLAHYENFLGFISGIFIGFGLIYSTNLLSNVRLSKEKTP